MRVKFWRCLSFAWDLQLISVLQSMRLEYAGYLAKRGLLISLTADGLLRAACPADREGSPVHVQCRVHQVIAIGMA